MAEYRISGIWIGRNGVITDYALHTILPDGISRAVKTAKAEAVRLLSIHGNSAHTLLWNYSTASWTLGSKIEVMPSGFLRTVHDNTVKDNLAHLINYDWLLNS